MTFTPSFLGSGTSSWPGRGTSSWPRSGTSSWPRSGASPWTDKGAPSRPVHGKSSWPDLTRPSIEAGAATDGRVEPSHDGEVTDGQMVLATTEQQFAV